MASLLDLTEEFTNVCENTYAATFLSTIVFILLPSLFAAIASWIALTWSPIFLRTDTDGLMLRLIVEQVSYTL